MLEFLKYLQKVRKWVNSDPKRFYLILMTVVVGFSGLSILLDILLPKTMLYHFIRSFVIIPFSVSLFTFLYGIYHRKFEQSESDNPLKDSVREKYSFNQRINISILTMSLLIVIHILVVSNESALYSILTALLCSALGFLALFVRPFRDEYLRAEYELEDERDLEHDWQTRVLKEEADVDEEDTE